MHVMVFFSSLITEAFIVVFVTNLVVAFSKKLKNFLPKCLWARQKTFICCQYCHFYSYIWEIKSFWWYSRILALFQPFEMWELLVYRLSHFGHYVLLKLLLRYSVAIYTFLFYEFSIKLKDLQWFLKTFFLSNPRIFLRN